jgi:putative hydrolase of the HAD superfamily
MQKDRVSTEDTGGSPIKAVIFDYGQVLVHSPTKEDFQSMADVLGVGFQSFYRLWETSRDGYDRGDVTAEEYWLKLAAQMGASIDRAQIEILRQIEVEIWAHPDQAMLVWLSALQSAGFKTALLSNMPLDLMTYVQENFQWMENFTFKTFSAEVRLIKPDPAIYEHTLRGLGVSADEALFVDDRETNIQAARVLGIHGILFRSIVQLKDDLETLGFPVLPAVAGVAGSGEHSTQGIKFQL